MLICIIVVLFLSPSWWWPIITVYWNPLPVFEGINTSFNIIQRHYNFCIDPSVPLARSISKQVPHSQPCRCLSEHPCLSLHVTPRCVKSWAAHAKKQMCEYHGETVNLQSSLSLAWRLALWICPRFHPIWSLSLHSRAYQPLIGRWTGFECDFLCLTLFDNTCHPRTSKAFKSRMPQKRPEIWSWGHNYCFFFVAVTLIDFHESLMLCEQWPSAPRCAGIWPEFGLQRVRSLLLRFW